VVEFRLFTEFRLSIIKLRENPFASELHVRVKVPRNLSHYIHQLPFRFVEKKNMLTLNAAI
jgi:hypothetical protein